MPKSTQPKFWAAKAGQIFNRFWQILEAMEEGPYGYMDERILCLEEKIKKMEKAKAAN